MVEVEPHGDFRDQLGAGHLGYTARQTKELAAIRARVFRKVLPRHMVASQLLDGVQPDGRQTIQDAIQCFRVAGIQRLAVDKVIPFALVDVDHQLARRNRRPRGERSGIGSIAVPRELTRPLG